MKNQNAPLKAMIIEDEKDLCYLLSHYLQKKSISITCANTIREAKDSIFEIKPTLLFVDNNLPDGSGIDFIASIKQNLPEMKIVMISAQNSKKDIEKAHNTGAHVFISKPFNFQTISNTLLKLAI